MEKKKIVATGVLAMMVAVSGQFVQVGATSGDAFFGMPKAEAGFHMPKIKVPKIGGKHSDSEDGAEDASGDVSLDGIKDQAEQAAKDAAKDAAKQQLEQALNVDLESMGSHTADMMKNLAFAAQMEAVAAHRWNGVANLDTANAAAASNLAKEFALGGNYNDWNTFQNFKQNYIADMTLGEGEKATFAALVTTAKDRLTLQENMDRIFEAKKARKTAAIYNALAARDASFVISQAAKSIAKAKDMDDILATAKNFSAVAKEAQAFIDAEKKISKERANATKKAEKASNVKDPSKEECEAYGKERLNEMM